MLLWDEEVVNFVVMPTQSLRIPIVQKWETGNLHLGVISYWFKVMAAGNCCIWYVVLASPKQALNWIGGLSSHSIILTGSIVKVLTKFRMPVAEKV